MFGGSHLLLPIFTNFATITICCYCFYYSGTGFHNPWLKVLRSVGIKVALSCFFQWLLLNFSVPIQHYLMTNVYIFYEVANLNEFVRPHSYDFVRFV